MEVLLGGLTHKTTILLSPELHERLVRLAAQRGTSIGDLIRSACERLYGFAGSEERLAAARELACLSLPVDSPARMKKESVARPEDLLP